MNTKYSLNTYLTILYFFFKKRYDNIIQHNLRTVSIKSMNQFNSNKNDVLDSYLGKNQDFECWQKLLIFNYCSIFY